MILKGGISSKKVSFQDNHKGAFWKWGKHPNQGNVKKAQRYGWAYKEAWYNDGWYNRFL